MDKLAIKMLWGDKTKVAGLLISLSFTVFLITFSMAYFAGFMTRGFALISENGTADIWVMDPAVTSTEMTTNLSYRAVSRIKNIEGVAQAVPLLLDEIKVRFPSGHFQAFQMIGVDNRSLAGVPQPEHGSITQLRAPGRIIVDAGGTTDKLLTPIQDQWPYDGAHLQAPMRTLAPGDTLIANNFKLTVAGVSHTIGRFPPRPLLYTTYDNAIQMAPSNTSQTTFVMVKVQPGVSPKRVADRINSQTPWRARTQDDFKKDTILWYLINSEDVGDMLSMISLAVIVGFGLTGILLFMFTYENLKQFATLKAIGALNDQLIRMVFVQILVVTFISIGIGLGVCALTGTLTSTLMQYPFRMMWFTPAIGILGVMLISFVAAWISIRPILKMSPGIVFAGR